MERSSKSFFFLAVSAVVILLACLPAVAEAPVDVQPNSGAVDGAVYTSKFFGFTYGIPEQWSVRSVATRMPGNGANMLLSLKPKSATGGLSTIMITATKLPTENDGVLWRYLLERYRLNQAADSDTTINGIPTSRMKRSAAPPDPAPLTFGDRTFYRLRVDSPAMSRIAIATTDKGHALVFEAIVPLALADQAEADLVSSLHSLNFAVPATVRGDKATNAKQP